MVRLQTRLTTIITTTSRLLLPNKVELWRKISHCIAFSRYYVMVTNIFLYEDKAIEGYCGEDVDAVHAQESEHKPSDLAEFLPEFPAKLKRGGEVHRNPEDRHDQLREGDVHQQKVEIRLELKHPVLL